MLLLSYPAPEGKGAVGLGGVLLMFRCWRVQLGL